MPMVKVQLQPAWCHNCHINRSLWQLCVLSPGILSILLPNSSPAPPDSVAIRVARLGRSSGPTICPPVCGRLPQWEEARVSGRGTLNGTKTSTLFQTVSRCLANRRQQFLGWKYMRRERERERIYIYTVYIYTYIYLAIIYIYIRTIYISRLQALPAAAVGIASFSQWCPSCLSRNLRPKSTKTKSGKALPKITAVPRTGARDRPWRGECRWPNKT